MPYCPKCGVEYLPEVDRCSDCDLKLVENPPVNDEEDFDTDIKTVLLCQTNDMINAKILEEALSDHNIPCLLKSSAGTYSGMGSMSQVMKGVKVYVPETAIEKAIEIAETVIPDFEIPDDK